MSVLFCVVAHRPVPVTSDMELSVMKNKIAELKAQLNKDAPRERSASSSGEKEQGFTFVSQVVPYSVPLVLKASLHQSGSAFV